MIWKAVMKAITEHIVTLDEYEKFFETYAYVAQDPRKVTCEECRFTAPNEVINVSQQVMPEITQVVFSGECAEEVQRLQNNTFKHALKHHEFREAIFIPDLMVSNSNGWARVKKLSSAALENIRGVAFYVLPDSSKNLAEPNPYDNTYEVLARDMRNCFPYLESIYLIRDTVRSISSVLPPRRAWKTIVADLPLPLKEREAWLKAYAESGCAENLLMWLVCFIWKRERHERCLRLGNKPLARGQGSSTDKDTSVGSRFNLEIKVVE